MTDRSSDDPVISQVRNGLEKIKAAYDKTTDPAKRRHCWLLQLELIIGLAYYQDIASFAALMPLRDMHLALFSLKNGVVEPPLKAKTVRGARQSARALFVRGYAAGLAALLIDAGETAKMADEIVAQRLNDLRFTTRRANRAITGATIKGWRKEAREAEFDDDVRRTYDQVVRLGGPHADFKAGMMMGFLSNLISAGTTEEES